jgi:hypothetical protein
VGGVAKMKAKPSRPVWLQSLNLSLKRQG